MCVIILDGGLVDKPARLGYVERTPDPGDGRATLIQLTEKSLALKDDLLDISRAPRARAFKNLSDDDRRLLAELLEKVVENL
ncbi:MAG: hypothetical protein V1816_05375 [Pseudomonadota bacterium]